MKPHNYSLLTRIILLRMLFYTAVFGLFAFWVPLKQVALGEPALWTASVEKVKTFFVFTLIFSILFGYRDYHKKRILPEDEL
jgi:hypothetical protein